MKIGKKMLLPLSTAALLLLAACGGGGGGGGSTSASTGGPGTPGPIIRPEPPPPPEPVDITDRIPDTIDPINPEDPPPPPPDFTTLPDIEPLATEPSPVPTTSNSAAFSRIRLGDAYARAVSPAADAAAVPLNGAGMTIGIMEEVNHFHPELAANIDADNSIFTSPYPADAEQPDPDLIIPEADFTRYPAQACYLQFGIPCPDQSGSTKYFLRMEDKTLRLIPGLQDREFKRGEDDSLLPILDTDNIRDEDKEISEFGVDHGTGVASIAAASMDETGHDRENLYGVAHEAEILVYARPVGIAGFDTAPSEHAAYFRDAPAAADVYNFSHVYAPEVTNPNLNKTTEFRVIAEVIAENGIPFVAAAGNEGYGFPQFPAAFPLFYPDLRGQIIAVTAVNTNGRIPATSNRCGGLPSDWNPARHGVHYCLAAPGTNLYAAEHYAGVTPGYHTVHGTSFAAPIVAGAVAILKQFFRGNITDRELVLRLLHTANRTGIYDAEATYGAGLLDLEAATRPVETLTMNGGVTMGEASYSLAETRLALSPAFGDALAHALADTEFAAFDALGAPFWRPASGLLSFHSPRLDLSTRLAETHPLPTPSTPHPYLSLVGEGVALGTPDFPLGPGRLHATAFMGGFANDQEDATFGTSAQNGSDQKGGASFGTPLPEGNLSAGRAGASFGTLLPKGNLSTGRGGASFVQRLPRDSAKRAGGRAKRMGGFGGVSPHMGGKAPHMQDHAKGLGGMLSYALTDTESETELAFQFGTPLPEGNLPAGRAGASFVQRPPRDSEKGWVGGQKTWGVWGVSPHMGGKAPHMQDHAKGLGGMLSYTLTNPKSAATLALQVGALIEESGPLGLQGEGGFANLQKAETLFTGINMHTEKEGWRLHAEALAAMTRSETTNLHLLRDLSTITSSAFRLGVEHDNGLAFTLRQPLRVEHAAAEISLPIGRSLSGDILRDTRALSLAPSGRELDASATYRFSLAPAAEASLTAGAVRHPGHTRSAAPEFYALANLRLRF